MTARARSQAGASRAQAAQSAPSPIGWANGRPHTAHHGGAKKSIAAQHVPHSASGSRTMAPQARQRGGRTASTTARPIRRNCIGRACERCAPWSAFVEHDIEHHHFRSGFEILCWINDFCNQQLLSSCAVQKRICRIILIALEIHLRDKSVLFSRYLEMYVCWPHEVGASRIRS